MLVINIFMNNKISGENGIQQVKLGIKSGIITLVLVLISTILYSVAIFYPGRGIEIIGSILSVATLIAYIVMLKGVRALAKEVPDESLDKNLKTVMILSGIAILPSVFISMPNVIPSMALVSMLAYIFVVFVAGLYSLKLSRDFRRLVDILGISSSKAARWHKISGWLMVTIIPLVLGIVLSFIADYYMWRLLRDRVKSRII